MANLSDYTLGNYIKSHNIQIVCNNVANTTSYYYDDKINVPILLLEYEPFSEAIIYDNYFEIKDNKELMTAYSHIFVTLGLPLSKKIIEKTTVVEYNEDSGWNYD